MAGIFTNNGEKVALDRLTSSTLTLRLYKNNYDPVAASVAGDFTECDFTGYTSKSLTSWPASATNGSSKAESTHPVQSWVNSGGSSQTIYGWYVTNGSGVVIAAEKFASSVTLAAGAPFAVTPTLTMVSE